MNNSTYPGLENLPGYVMYIVCGTVMGSSHLIIFISVARYEALRTSRIYVLLMALSLSDTINMFGFFTGGIRRTWLIFTGEHDTLYTPWQCSMALPTVVWSFSSVLANSMLTTVSIDRFLCVTFPMRYIGLSYKYVMMMSGVTYLYSVGSGIIGLVLAYGTKDDEPVIPAGCNPHVALGVANKLYSIHYSQANMVWASVSVVIYIVVWIIHKTRNSVHATSQSQKQQLSHERKFTKSLAINCLCTFWLFIVPYQLAVLSNKRWPQYPVVALILWNVSNLNTMANAVIYVKRHEEMRQAIKGLFTCKTMPVDVKMWKVNQQQAQVQIESRM